MRLLISNVSIVNEPQRTSDRGHECVRAVFKKETSGTTRIAIWCVFKITTTATRYWLTRDVSHASYRWPHASAQDENWMRKRASCVKDPCIYALFTPSDSAKFSSRNHRHNHCHNHRNRLAKDNHGDPPSPLTPFAKRGFCLPKTTQLKRLRYPRLHRVQAKNGRARQIAILKADSTRVA